MGPIEVLFGSLLVVFLWVGVIRTYPKELGVTTLVLAALYIMYRFGNQALKALEDVIRRFGLQIAGTPNEKFIEFTLYLFFLLFIVFISYEGITLEFPGTPPKGTTGVLLNLASGFLNGYLVLGTIWYYLDRFNYPVQQFKLFTPPLSPFAQKLIPLLPQNLLPQPDMVFLGFLLFLLILRVIK